MYRHVNSLDFFFFFACLQGSSSGVKWLSGSPTGRVLSRRAGTISPVRTAFTLRPPPSRPSASTTSPCPARRRCPSPRCPRTARARRRSVTAARVRVVRCASTCFQGLFEIRLTEMPNAFPLNLFNANCSRCLRRPSRDMTKYYSDQ